MQFSVKTLTTKPFLDQKAGTSGLRQKTKVFMQENYSKNFIQSVINYFATTKNVKELKVLICGDGRYYNSIVIQELLNILAANYVKCVFVPKNGHMSTPDASFFLNSNKVDFAFVLSASHNPAGVNGDFGIKINTISGAPATAEQMNAIYEQTKIIEKLNILEPLHNFDITNISTFNILETEVIVDDFVDGYLDYLETIFNFKEIGNYIKESGLQVAMDSLNAVTSVYAKKLFLRLNIAYENIFNDEIKEDFGRYAADPNPKDAKHAYDMMVKDKKFDFACVFDGDGDRAMVLGKGVFISPVDSLAIIAKYSTQQDYYKNKIYGFARTFATSCAVDKVAKSLNIPLYVVPTGWKYFTNLLDNKKITICGEESFGASSFHIREKDGIWVFLFWLDILRVTKKSVASVAKDFYTEYGRNYFLRYDYNNLSSAQADNLIKNLEENGTKQLGKEALSGLELTKVYNASYFDEFDKVEAKNQGLILEFGENARIVTRKSGTATGSVTLRVYIEKYNPKDFSLNIQSYLKPLQDFFESNSCFAQHVDLKNYKSLDIIG